MPAEETNRRQGHRATRFATVSQVATYLNLSRPTVYRLMREGALRSIKLGKARRIAWEDVDTLVGYGTVTR